MLGTQFCLLLVKSRAGASKGAGEEYTLQYAEGVSESEQEIENFERS